MMKDIRATRYLFPVALILFTLLLSPNALAKVGQITQYPVLTGPYYITAGPDGNLSQGRSRSGHGVRPRCP